MSVSCCSMPLLMMLGRNLKEPFNLRNVLSINSKRPQFEVLKILKSVSPKKAIGENMVLYIKSDSVELMRTLFKDEFKKSVKFMDYDSKIFTIADGELFYALQKFVTLLSELGALNPHEGSLYYAFEDKDKAFILFRSN